MPRIKFEGEEKQKRQIEQILLKEEEKVAKKTAKVLGMPYENLAFKIIQSLALKIVPERAARRAKLAVIRKEGLVIKVAVASPEDKYAQEIIEDLRKKFQEVLVSVVSFHSLEKAWAVYKESAGEKKITGEVAVAQKAFQKFRKEIATMEGLQNTLKRVSSQKDVSIVVEVLLAASLSLDVSDIHIEPGEDNIRLRLRIDGMLHDIYRFDEHIYKLLLSRIKLLSNLKLNIHDSAQDGRFSVKLEDFEIQIRTSVFPGEYGENIVLRILNPKSLLSLEALGIRKDLLDKIEDNIKKPNGMILATGPTGAGKTTTLYAFLKKLKTPEIKIITIEDPIEYHLEGISQTQVVPEKGYTFANGLRSALRQDPDVILVGEIRDLETADTALQAALTGHLVLSTLHTNDAAGVIPRLVDIGANPSTIGPALNIAIAQRLIRRVCSRCKSTRLVTKKELETLKEEFAPYKNKVGVTPEIKNLLKKINPSLKTPIAKGCNACSGMGYKGRVGIYEIVISDSEFEKFILENPTITDVRSFLSDKGMTTLLQDGFLKVIEGVTTIEEVERITGD